MRPHLPQIVSPVVIGRGAELTALEEALEATQLGLGSCILIAGEAGVGKSRLLLEIRQRALAEHFVVLQGNCFEQDLAFPYSLWINALRTFLAWSSASETREQIGPLAAELVKLLPELALILPGTQASRALDSESEKRRLFEAVARFALRLAAARPLLIELEDLHWSDAMSLELLQLIMQRVAGRPMLLVASYRNDEQPRQLTSFLAQVNRERMATELLLAPLTRSETAEMIAAILKFERLPRDPFVDLILRLTEGNPFFIEEVLRSLSATDDAAAAKGGARGSARWAPESMKAFRVPPSIHDIVRRRMEQLQPETRRILTLAAVVGERFRLELFQAVSGRDEPRLLAAIRELIAAHFVVEASADELAFRHALTREAVYASLLMRERQGLHQLIGETMEQLWGASGPSYAAALAYHFAQATVWEKALRYSQLAGEQAQRLFAPREALAQFSLALQSAERLHVLPSWSIPSRRGHALELLGEFDAARLDYEGALDLARQQQDREGEWSTLIDLGFLWQSRDWVRAGEYFQAAYDLARSLEQTALVARSLNRMGNWNMNRGRGAEGLSCHRQALALFEELHDRQGTARTLELMGFVSYFLGDIIQGARYCEQAVPILRELDDREGLVNALGTLSMRTRFDTEVLGTVDLRQLAGQSETAAQVARSCGYRRGEADASLKAAVCLCRAGEYGRGLEHLRQALGIAQELEHREMQATAHLAWGLELCLGLLAAAEAQEHLEAALATAHELGSVSLTLLVTASLALAYILDDDLTRAEEVLVKVTPAGLPGDADLTMVTRAGWAARAELELARGRPARALEIVDRLLAATTNLREYGPYAVPRLTRLRANALAGLSRTDEAAGQLAGALEVARAQGQRPIIWRIHVDLGRACRSLGRRTAAAEHFAAARKLIQELADDLPQGTLRDHFLTEALARLPAERARTPRRAFMQAMGGLTERERQVAALIAAGSSNREISRALVITERTVEAHITSILTKLEMKSRTEIAAWAVARGLAYPPS
jgi:DNA-binding CsgD family transcriptional regulator